MTTGVALRRRASGITLASVAAALAASIVAGALAFSLGADVSPSTVVPVTLANGSNCTGGCTTTLNAPATSATTGTGSLSPITDRQFLKVVHGATAWNVQVRALSISGTIVTDAISLSLVSTSTATITLNSVNLPPLLSASVPLAGGAGATDVGVNARGVCLGTCVIGLEFVVTSGSASYTYPATLTVT